MRNFTLLIIFIFSGFLTYSQTWSIRDLAGLTFQPEKKVSNYLYRKGYNNIGVDHVDDTLVTSYSYRGKKRNKNTDSTFRFLNLYVVENNQGLSYQTSSGDEAESIVNEIIGIGFIKPRNVLPGWPQLFQKNDVSIIYTSYEDEGELIYNFRINRNNLPPAVAIRYAEDLLVVQSNKQLRYIYGDRKVKNIRE